MNININSLHPICLLTRTDAEVGVLVESFFLFKYSEAENGVQLCLRLPSAPDCRNSHSSKMDIVQQGLQMFILERVSKSTLHELCGFFAVTGSDGIRFFAFFRSFNSSVFVSVSSFPILNTVRELFDLLELEKPENVLPILNVLCELPIVPAAGAKYRLQLSHGSTMVKFNLADQVNDASMDVIILTVMTPLMLVRAWESIIMERKVLVVSSIDSIITACCEFIRRLALPLEVVNTYVPLLPPELINTIEAPFPYLLGANSDVVRDSAVDVSETVIIDLDARTVIRPKSKEAIPEGASAPPAVVSKLVHDINLIICEPLGSYFQRPSNSHGDASQGSNNLCIYPFSEEYFSYRCTQILQMFVQTNLSLISARHCKVKAFFRRPVLEGVPEDSLHSGSTAAARNAQHSSVNIGYSIEKGVHHGFVHLIRNISTSVEKSDKTTAGSSHFSNSSERLPCWLEVDSCSLAVYEQHVDDLPVVYVNSKDITSVSPSPNEPEGQVFELFVNEGSRYLLIATTSEARRQWIQAVDTVMKNARGGDASSSDLTSMKVAEDSPNKDESAWQSEFANTDKKAVDIDAQFRQFFMKTQMSSSLFSKLEAPQYESILKETNIKFPLLMKSISNCDDAIASTLWRSGSIQNIIRQVVVNNTSQRNPKIMASHPDFEPSKITSSRTESTCTIQSDGGLTEKSATTTPVSRRRDSGTSSATRILRWLISRTPSTEQATLVSIEKATGGGSEDNSPTNRERVIKNFLRERITSCVQSYRRCQAEINIVLTQDRQAALSPILDMDLSSPGSDSTTITVPLLEIVESMKLNPKLDCSSSQQFEKSPTLQSDNSNVRSQRWHDFMWFALMGGHWDHSKVHATPSRMDSYDGASFSPPHDMIASPETLSFDGEEFDEYDDLLIQDNESSRSTSQRENGFPLANSKRANEKVFPTACDGVICKALLAWIDNCKLRLSQVLIPLSNTMSGHLNERLCEWEKALSCYAEGGLLVNQHRVMVCIVNHFADFVHCESEKTGDGGAGGGKDGVTTASAETEGQSVLRNRMSTSDSTDHNEDNDGIVAGMSEMSVGFDRISQFLEWANGVKPAVGLHAYRFLVEMLYQYLLPHYDRVSALAGGLQPSAPQNMYQYPTTPVNKTLALGSHRSFPGKHGNLASKQRMIKLYKMNAAATPTAATPPPPSSSASASSVPSPPLESISHSRNDLTEFTWVDAADTKSETLNELVTCIAANEHVQPCEFSTELLSRVREVLRTYCENLAKITPTLSAELAAASAFTTFELQCCQLQKIDLSGLSVNQRTLFFCNIFNTLTVHAVIRKGNPGSSMLERSAFMRSSKYNLNGMIFSLLDIEHGILRNSSTKAIILGPLTIKYNFPDRDPRKILALEEPKPLISFCLFDACVTSPLLVVLKDANRLNEELQHHARNYLIEHVKCDPTRKSIELPGLIRTYWGDFGNNKLRVLKMIMKATGLNLSDQQLKIEFAAIDWTPLLAL